MSLPYTLDRDITIQAPPATVFSFFTDNERWAGWWGAGSTIDPRVGGHVYIRHPGNVEVKGEVLEIDPPRRLVFTYGYASGAPFGPGGSRVTIALEPSGAATRLHLTHEFPQAAARDEHVQGWRFQLSLFGNAVANLVHRDAAASVDAWFALWTEPDAAARMAAMRAIASESVAFRDRFSLIDGAEDLSAHITAAQHFMPGLTIARRGDVRQCQGTAIAEWTAVGPDQAPRGQGTNVFVLGPDGKINGVTGFWG
jgi:uncharacterized protein YndB with AHSA1/START domain